MVRRRESFLDMAALLPWWINFILAVICYAVLKYLAPALHVRNPFTHGFLHASSGLAPLGAFIFIFAGILSIWRRAEGRYLLQTNQDIGAIRRLDWREFEKLVAAAYQRQGFTVKHTGGAGPDGGVDVVLAKDGRDYLVQCKHWKVYKVSVQPVRELAGVVSVERASGGIFVTTGKFTEEAKAFGKQAGLTLIAGDELVEMLDLAEHNPYAEVMAKSDPVCPQCGSPMKRRIATKGVHKGEPFWGCSRFPACRGIVKDYG